MKRQQQGFTLIEIAIVLVIIGLLLGGVLKGQELITSARVRNLISQQDGVKAAFFGFQDRFRALPGDYASASTNLKCGGGNCLNGNGNGQIQANATPVNSSEVHEDILAWSHLTGANFLNGSYVMTAAETTQTDANSPKNPYSIYMQLVYDANYAGTATDKHNLKTGSQIPVEILAEVDRKIDDGNPLQGGFRFSTFVPNGGTALAAPAAAHAAGVCANSTAPGAWFSTDSETNCGAASLF